MRRRTYRITFLGDTSGKSPWIEEVDADEIGHVCDGAVTWLNFHDGAGEVLRVRSSAVERVDRIS